MIHQCASGVLTFLVVASSRCLMIPFFVISHLDCLPMIEFELPLCPYVLRASLVRISSELHCQPMSLPLRKFDPLDKTEMKEKTSARMVSQKESPHKCSKVVTAKRQQKKWSEHECVSPKRAHGTTNGAMSRERTKKQ